jgi:hypothetical protein
MQEIYNSHGVRFRYPNDWNISEQSDEGRISITVSSPRTSFWTVSVFPDGPEPRDVVEAVLDAFREEYPELDIYAATAKLCDRRAVAKNIEFVCLELLNSAWVRAVRTPHGTILVLYQGTDAEIDETGSTLERMTRSLEFAAQNAGDSTDEYEPADEEAAEG